MAGFGSMTHSITSQQDADAQTDEIMTEDISAYVDEFGFVGPLTARARAGHLPAEGFPTGPEVGERLPDFELPAADGRRVRLHADRAGSKAAVTFFRSAVW